LGEKNSGKKKPKSFASKKLSWNASEKGFESWGRLPNKNAEHGTHRTGAGKRKEEGVAAI